MPWSVGLIRSRAKGIIVRTVSCGLGAPLVPQRPRPELIMPRSGELPAMGNPNSSKERRDENGNIIQRRYYGGDGRAIININYDHDHGSGKPHAHDWEWTQDPPVRLTGRALTASEKRNSK